MSNFKIPYEISLWEDRLVAVDTSGIEHDDFVDSSNTTIKYQYHKERKICIIGSHTMNTAAAAVEPKLVEKVDGTHTLTFSIYSKYYDEETGELVDNPFVQYLTNERKVKLKHWPKNTNESVWIDLVIKKIEEGTENYKFNYTATDIFINELSKTGYNLVFDADLNNNIGSVTYLGEQILAGTDWDVDKAGSNEIQQTIEEPVYKWKLQKSISAYTVPGQNSSKITIAAGAEIYPFYSCINNKTEDFFQFIYLGNEEPLVDQNGIIQNKGCQYYTTNITVAEDSSDYDDEGYNNSFRAERYVRTQEYKYEEELERYVNKYAKDEDATEYYGYTETDYVSPVIVQNLIVNGESIISSDGWKYLNTSDGTVDLRLYPNHTEAIKYDNRLNLLVLPKNKTLINTGFISNARSIEKITKGDQYVFRIKGGLLGKDGANYCVNSKQKFKISFYDKKNKCFLATSNTPTDAKEDTEKFRYSILTFQETLTEEDLKNIYIYISEDYDDDSDANNYYIEEVQLFPLVRQKNIDDNKNYILLPGAKGLYQKTHTVISPMPINTEIVTTYTYYHIADDKIVVDSTGAQDTSYKPVYVSNYGKIRSITAKESNRFNLLQDLSEAFECWCKFTIEHDDNGKVILEEVKKDGSVIGKKPKKYVTFHKQIGQKKSIGFTYGINLKSISRSLDSNALATKLIVKSNANEFAQAGSCNIARAPQNPSGENFIYDFSYFIKQGLLNEYNVYNDLYNNNTSMGYVGLFPYLKPLNQERDTLILQNSALTADYSTYSSNKTGDQVIYDKTVETLEDLETKFADIVNASFPDIVKNYKDKTITGYKDYSDKDLNEIFSKSEELTGIAASIDLYTQKKAELEAALEKSTDQLADVEEALQDNLDRLNEIETNTATKINEFENKYSRFIQEGSWTSEDYIDDNLYYMDAESTLHNSASPKVSYTINVVDLSQLEGYENYRFELGDITYIQDTDFFGWKVDEETGARTPYKEEIVVTEVTTVFHEPDKKSIKVQNYKNQFDDLFQRLTASAQQLRFHSGEYDRSADVVNGNGMIQPGALQEAFNNNAYTISNINNQSVEMGEQGIIITNNRLPNEIVRLASGGIFLTKDGGETWTTGITPNGINAKVITTGTLNAGLVNIVNGTQPTIIINKDGFTGRQVTGQGDEAVIQDVFELKNGKLLVGSEGSDSYMKFENGLLTVKGNVTANGLAIYADDAKQTEILVTKTTSDGKHYVNLGGWTVYNYKLESDKKFASIDFVHSDPDDPNSPEIPKTMTSSYFGIFNYYPVHVAGWKDVKVEGFDTAPYYGWRMICGKTWDKPNFGISAEGNLYCQNAFVRGTVYATDGEFTGDITAKSLTLTGSATVPAAKITGDLSAGSATIAGWTIEGGIIYKSKHDGDAGKSYSAAIRTSAAAFAVYEKEGRDTGAPSLGESWKYNFCVNYSGELVAKKADITGTITATGGTFSNCTIDNTCTINGTLKASNITGALSTNVTIAGWKIGNGNLYSNDYGFIGLYTNSPSITVAGQTKDDWRIVAGAGTDRNFGVDKSGNLYAKGANISGILKAGNGSTIGGWDISGGTLSATGTDKQKWTRLSTEGVEKFFSSPSETWNTIGWAYVYNVAWEYANIKSSDSDINIKNNISNIDNYNLLFDNLKPCRYKYNYSTSDRYHTGFIAQEVVSALEQSGLTTQDFAGVVHLKQPNENGSEWILRRDEFVALNTWQIQKLKSRVAELEQKIAALESKGEL